MPTNYIRQKLKDENGNYIITPSLADMVYHNDGETVENKYNKVKDDLSVTKIQLNEISEDLCSNLSITNIFKSKFIALTFTAKNIDDSETYLKILTSNDGVNWKEFMLEYQSPSLRDPVMFEKDGFYFITGTNLITTTKTQYLKTKDFLNFELVNVGDSLLSNFSMIWAPDVFNVGNDLYMTASLSRDIMENMSIYITKLDQNLKPVGWSKIQGEIPHWCYDGHFIVTKDKYYLVLKDSSEVRGIRVYESTKLTSGYKRLVHIDYDDLQEAPYLMKLEDGTLRLYVDTYEGEGQISYKDSYDNGYSWTELKKINIDTGLKAKHLHIYNIGGYDWKYNFSLNPNISVIQNIDSLEVCEKRLFGASSQGTFPEILNVSDRWGYITNVSTGSGNYIQTMTTLSNRNFIRNYINNTWGDWVIILNSNDAIDHEMNIPLSSTYVSSGYCRLNALSTIYRRKQVNIQANFKLKAGVTGLIKIAEIPQEYRSRVWIVGDAFSGRNIEENIIKWELIPENGYLNLMIHSDSSISSNYDITFNINYICN